MSALIKNEQVPNPLGDRLRQVRFEGGISLAKASKDLGIAVKYLEAIENNHPAQLPGGEYFNFFLKRYCNYLKLDYRGCLELCGKRKTADSKNVFKNSQLIRSRLNKGFVYLIAIAALLVFLIWNVEAIFRPPKLEITEPLDGVITLSRQVAIKGETAKESEVSINNRPVLVDSSGNFSVLVDLQKGLNLIKISAKKRYSRPSEVEIRVLFKEIANN